MFDVVTLILQVKTLMSHQALRRMGGNSMAIRALLMAITVILKSLNPAVARDYGRGNDR